MAEAKPRKPEKKKPAAKKKAVVRKSRTARKPVARKKAKPVTRKKPAARKKAVVRKKTIARKKAVVATKTAIARKSLSSSVSWSGAGSKLKDAKKHGVQVIDEVAWVKMGASSKEKDTSEQKNRGAVKSAGKLTGAGHQGHYLFRQSSTKSPLRQTVKTVTASVDFWHIDDNPDTIYGRFIGYGGGGGQEEGCFKLMRKVDAFFLSYSGEHERGWDWISEAGKKFGKTMTKLDKENVSDDILGIMDPTSEEAKSYIEKKSDVSAFDSYVDALDPSCCIFSPSTLHAMEIGYGEFFNWEDGKDEECLCQISQHWPLAYKFVSVA